MTEPHEELILDLKEIGYYKPVLIVGDWIYLGLTGSNTQDKGLAISGEEQLIKVKPWRTVDNTSLDVDSMLEEGPIMVAHQHNPDFTDFMRDVRTHSIALHLEYQKDPNPNTIIERATRLGEAYKKEITRQVELHRL